MSEGQNRNYYTLLGVERSATKEQIRDAYKELARIYHPDSRFYDEIIEAAGVATGESETFKLITLAYNTLTNEKERAAYDQMIPADLPSWEEDQKDEWHTDHMEQSYPRTPPKKPTHNGFGNMESSGHIQRPAPRSAFDDAKLREVKLVSEIIKKKRSFWWKLKWLFFLER